MITAEIEWRKTQTFQNNNGTIIDTYLIASTAN